MIVGNGAEADMVAMFGGQESKVRELSRPSELGIEPERNIVAAAEVVDAIVMAAGGRGWL